MQRSAIRTLTVALLAFLAVSAQGSTPEGGAGVVHLVGKYIWRIHDPRFGGFSSIEVSDDGQSFTTVSDRGELLTGRFRRDARQKIVGVDPGDFVHLKGPKGQPVDYKLATADSEGLAIAPDGTIYISFELFSRVVRYRTATSNGATVNRPKDWDVYNNNYSFESLAIDSKGRLYTMPERSLGVREPFPVFRFNGKHWEQPFSIPRPDEYVPVGSDFGPDGKFYLLERQFIMPFGFRTRVMRFDVTETGFINQEILLDTRTGTFDNLEGLAVWRDARGAIRLTMISDDNFNPFQQTQIVEFTVP